MPGSRRFAPPCPSFRNARKARFVNEYGLSAYDAELLTGRKDVADYFEEAVKDHANPKALSNWIVGDLFRVLKERKLDEQLYLACWPSAASNLAQMVQMIDQGKISGKIAKTVFEAMLDSNKAAPANRQRKRPGATFRSGQHRGSYRSGARGQSQTNRSISIRQR